MFKESPGDGGFFVRSALACLLVLVLGCQSAVFSLGMMPRIPVAGPHLHIGFAHPHRALAKRAVGRSARKTNAPRHACKVARKSTDRSVKRAAVQLLPPPQDFIGKLVSKKIASGVIYKSYRGKLSINVIDVNLSRAPVCVRPVLAGDNFSHLADVKSDVKRFKAIAAVNANYFKQDGTPLGTLIIDKEWVAGPLYDRVSLGITGCGFVRMDCVNLNGVLSTSNPAAPSLWVNNMNQPRRHGSRLILYTRRWGEQVRLPYVGCLVAVNAGGQVVDNKTTAIKIPPGGFVLSDSRSGRISKLRCGDLVKLSWNTTPREWADVVQAVSGGPMLIKNGELYVDLKAENFKKAWTGRQIQARTACGVTAYNHLLLVTIEGSHTLWDFAKFLRKLGAVDAMNLDGGGSTTMVVNGVTVTRNAHSYQRRVASSLAVIAIPQEAPVAKSVPDNFSQSGNPSSSGAPVNMP